MSDSRWVVDADLGAVNAAAKKTKGEFDQVGKSIGSWDKGIAGVATRMASLVSIISKINDEIRKSQNQRIENSKATGEQYGSLAKSVRSLGLASDPKGVAGVIDSLITESGPATMASRVSFAGEIAESARGNGGSYAPADVMRAMGMHRGGLFSNREVIDSLKVPGGAESLSREGGARYGALTPMERAEDLVRQSEHRDAVVSHRSDIVAADFNLRLADSQMKREITADRGSLGEMIFGVSQMLPFVDAFAETGRRGMTADANRLLNPDSDTNEVTRILSDIAESNRKMSAGRPSIGTTPDGGPP